MLETEFCEAIWRHFFGERKKRRKLEVNLKRPLCQAVKNKKRSSKIFRLGGPEKIPGARTEIRGLGILWDPGPAILYFNHCG